jgi:hypothetical protein
VKQSPNLDLDVTPLTRAGVSWAELRGRCQEVILFGSRAAGLSGARSDWDLLCIGERASLSLRVPGVDIVWLSTRVVDSQRWLSSELAGHIADWGVRLQGACTGWQDEARGGTAAVERKWRRSCTRIRALERAWRLLSPRKLQHHCTLLRRDLQRLEVLVGGKRVPSTPTLDAAWAAPLDRSAEFVRLLRNANMPRLDDALVELASI